MCPDGYACIWKKASLQGQVYVFTPTSSCYWRGWGRSASNQSGHAVAFCKNHNCTGPVFVLLSGYYAHSVGWNIASSRIG
ncbi:peptidase inhibitor family I36 protein [Amycolatopsis circi]|uniref:peptidase inhibitor family I36 protein n=1 Tax=Amycolatopsis circi TaxID=871959 RepID=UPI003CC5C596